MVPALVAVPSVRMRPAVAVPASMRGGMERWLDAGSAAHAAASGCAVVAWRHAIRSASTRASDRRYGAGIKQTASATPTAVTLKARARP